MKTINACVKNSEFTAIFDTHIKGRIDLTRLRLMAHFMCARCAPFPSRSWRKPSTIPPLPVPRTQEDPALRGGLRPGRRHPPLGLGPLPEKDRVGLTMDRTNWTRKKLYTTTKRSCGRYGLTGTSLIMHIAWFRLKLGLGFRLCPSSFEPDRKVLRKPPQSVCETLKIIPPIIRLYSLKVEVQLPAK